MQNHLRQPVRDRRKQVLIEKNDLDNIFSLSQNWAPWLKEVSSPSKMIKKDQRKSTVAKGAYKEKILPIATRCLKRQMSEIQGETSWQEEKALIIPESIKRQSAKQGPKANASEHLSTPTATDENTTDMHLCQNSGIKTVHTGECGIECISQRAKTYVSLIQPDQEYIKSGPDSYEINNWPPNIEDFVSVTEEDNRWRIEFEYQEKFPEGTVLLRPSVTMIILVAMIICQSPDKMLMCRHIYGAIQKRFPYFLYMPKKEQDGWKGTIRSTLTNMKWFSKVEFGVHSVKHLNYYYTFNCNTMPDNWNLSARSITKAVHTGSVDKRILKDQGSNREASPPIAKTILPYPLNDETFDSYTEPMTSVMTLSQPGSSATNIWEVQLPIMSNHTQNLSPVILYEMPFESIEGLTEI